MKRMLILVCCLLLAFAAYAVENSAVIGDHSVAKGTVTTVTQLTNAAPMTVQMLKARIEKMEALGQDATLLKQQLESLRGTHRPNGNRLDAVGDNCADPIVVSVPGALPYTDAARSTELAVDDYNTTCLGYYDGGPDVIYRLDVTAATVVTITCATGASTYPGMVVSAECPPPATGCIAYQTGYDGPISITNLSLDVGTYYLMVDNWAPGPDFIVYDLTITAVAATGRCCYPNPDACNPSCMDNVTQSACAALGGVYTAGETCTGYTCPIPPVGDLCCNALALAVPGTQSGTTVGFTNNYDYACPSTSTSPDVVYAYTPMSDEAVTFDLCGSTLDTKVYIYMDDCATTPIACNDDYTGCGSNYQSKLDCIPLLGLHTYYVVVDGWGGDEGDYVLVTSVCQEINCDQLTNCGTPVEVEPNDACPPPAEQAMLGCVDFGCPGVIPAVYGKHCPSSDVDWWAVCVPGLAKITVTPWEGANCDVTPVSFLGQFYFDDCTTVLGGAFSGAFAITNSGPTSAVLYLKLYGGATPVAYKLTAECCHLANPCDYVIEVPCGNPGPIWHYNTTVNTCPTDPCGTAYVPSGVWEDACGGSAYSSGASKIFMIHTYAPAANINITCTAAASGDEQVMVFTDCADPMGTCVASADLNASGTGPEVITGLALPIPGIYYISVSYYRGTVTCGEITLDITSDVQLPVELGDVSIAPLDNAVLLKWDSRSETNLDKWIVKRDNVAVYQVNANNGSNGHTYSFTDLNAVNGRTYSYDLVVREANGSESVVKTMSATPAIGATIVNEFALHQNYPNPFNPTTDIMYDLKDASFVSLKVYNLMGQQVATLVNGNMTQGRHTISFDGTNLPSGLYVCKMTAGSFSADMKMLLMK